MLSTILPICVGVVKVVLRLQDPSPPNLADAIDDLSGMYDRVGNELERRKLARHTEDLVDEVARHLSAEIQVEYPHLDPDDLVIAVAEVASRLQVLLPLSRTDRVAVLQSANPAIHLYEQVAKGAALDVGKRALGEQIESLSQTILRNACHSIVAIMRKQPELSVDMLAESLRSTGQLSGLVEDVRSALHDIPRRVGDHYASQALETEDRVHRDFTTEYLRAVVDEYDRLELYGLDLEWDVVHYSLTLSYVTLRLGSNVPQSGAKSLSEALSNPGVTYLRGPAGSGKTTILQWLSVNLARRRLPPTFRSMATRIPFVLRLRNYADIPLPPFEELGAITTSAVLLPEPAGWVHRVASRGDAVMLLVDGIDEFPEARRAELVDWLRTAYRVLRDPVIVVTGRASAEKSAQAIAAAFRRVWNDFDIQPMARDEIRSFVLHWHKAANAGRRDRDQAEEAIRIADSLSGSREYRLLASTPLLCAALCALFYVRRGAVPSSRIEVYQTLIRLMLSQRDSQRGVSVDALPLDAYQRQFVLEELANFMLVNNLSEVARDRAEMCVERALAAVPGPNDASSVLNGLLRRSGVIREPSNGQVDFVHRTFLEYLAAESHVRLDNIESLAEHADDPNWAETAILAGSLANVSQYRSLALKVMGKGKRSGEGDRPADWLVAIAAGLLRTRRSRVADVDRELELVLGRALPPVTTEQVRSIVAAGEGLFPELVSSLQGDDSFAAGGPASSEIVSATIRALGEHGGERALEALSSLPGSLRLRHIQDLLAVWVWFNLVEFRSAVLADLSPSSPTPAILSTSKVFHLLSDLSKNFEWRAVIEYAEPTLFDDCQGAPLSSLVVRHVDAVEDERVLSCRFVEGLVAPRQIVLYDAPSFAPEHVGENMAELVSIEIELKGGFADLRTLNRADALQALSISGRGEIRDASGAAEGLRVNELSVRGVIEVSSGVVVVARHVQIHWLDYEDILFSISDSLHEIDLTEILGLKDFEFLLEASAVSSVSVSDCGDLRDLAALLSLPRLSHLEIRGRSDINDAEMLAHLEEVVEVVVLDWELESLIHRGRERPESIDGLATFNEFGLGTTELDDWLGDVSEAAMPSISKRDEPTRAELRAIEDEEEEMYFDGPLDSNDLD